LQAAEQRKGVAGKDKEAGAMQRQLDAAAAKVEACRTKMQVGWWLVGGSSGSPVHRRCGS
jgi:hypothetical protein